MDPTAHVLNESHNDETTMKTKVFIAPTTHWDREWVQPQIQYQIRLVDLVDKLLRILEEDPAYKCFVFDGQTIPLQDYLEIKPENRERLARLCQQGRIVAGPWYVLADQFLEDAESTVRNLKQVIEECPVENGRVVCRIAPFAIATVRATIQSCSGRG